MRLKLLLVLLVLVVGCWVYVSRKRYEARPVTVASGRTFRMNEREAHCMAQQGMRICFSRVEFEAPSLDSATFRKDAIEIARTAHESAERKGHLGVMVLGYRPGFLRLFPPDSARAIFEQRIAAGTWRVVGDTTMGRMNWIFTKGLW